MIASGKSEIQLMLVDEHDSVGREMVQRTHLSQRRILLGAWLIERARWCKASPLSFRGQFRSPDKIAKPLSISVARPTSCCLASQRSRPDTRSCRAAGLPRPRILFGSQTASPQAFSDLRTLRLLDTQHVPYSKRSRPTSHGLCVQCRDTLDSLL